MSITQHMQRLGAPVKNVNWSWGGVRADGSVVLKVWADEVKDKRWVRIFHQHDMDASPGKPERAEHIAMVKAGAKAYAVMQQPENGDSQGRHERMKSFDKETVFVLEGFREDEIGNIWMFMSDRIPARTLMDL